ncbi:hypothetical protein EV141_1131 [Microcella putealis]|uniref:Glycosyltransferase involved in cell wall biosynthesis n=1 Tax=Microcella putealis TaxID=337005 RepID=A0A4Q7LUF1_9MICO|nr:hypothetical protein [Microcella putealis]RZS57419.1 hypothetical protein EV141_1131 [Microcella putealis]TQM19438.1 hypothetical protein BJ957_2260 [Microcella putealis]
MTSRVVILDDYFPSLLTGFRVSEFTYLLREGAVDAVMTTAEPYAHLSQTFGETFPDLANRVMPFDPSSLADAGGAYITFVNNARYFMPYLVEHKLPVVLQLYPGGGLNLGDPNVDRLIIDLRASGLLRGLVVTTERARTWLESLDVGDVPVALIPGVAIERTYLGPGAGSRTNYYPTASDVLRFGFVAHKYSADGRDKGFPDFLATLAAVMTDGISVQGSVIGGFTPDDVPAGHQPLLPYLTFHGPLLSEAMKAVLFSVDLVVSQNRADVLAVGQFDGFPTASSVIGSLCGAGLVLTDPLNQNRLFVHGRDALIVPDDPAVAAASIVQLLNGIGIQALARHGLRVTRRHYGVQAQLAPRLEFLQSVFA